MAVTGNYVQTAAGVLNADIGGTAGTKFDQLNVTGAVTLGGTLNLSLINSFVPTIGSTFDIMNFASSTGTFATINGTHINSSEHFAVVVNPTNVTLSVVAGPAPPWDSGFSGAAASGESERDARTVYPASLGQRTRWTGRVPKKIKTLMNHCRKAQSRVAEFWLYLFARASRAL